MDNVRNYARALQEACLRAYKERKIQAMVQLFALFRCIHFRFPVILSLLAAPFPSSSTLNHSVLQLLYIIAVILIVGILFHVISPAVTILNAFYECQNVMIYITMQ